MYPLRRAGRYIINLSFCFCSCIKCLHFEDKIIIMCTKRLFSLREQH